MPRFDDRRGRLERALRVGGPDLERAVDDERVPRRAWLPPSRAWRRDVAAAASATEREAARRRTPIACALLEGRGVRAYSARGPARPVEPERRAPAAARASAASSGARGRARPRSAAAPRGAAVERVRAARMEAAARRRPRRVGHLAGQRLGERAAPSGVRHRADQRLGVRMERQRPQLLRRRRLDDDAEVHDGDRRRRRAGRSRGRGR